MSNRPSWDEYFMSIAKLTSNRSHDEETKVGCVIVSDKKIISTGYNGFCSDINDTELPRTRPGKYPFIVHAEQNAICNLISKPDRSKLYCTKMPCSVCSKLLWQSGVREWIIPDSNYNTFSKSKDDDNVIDLLVSSGLTIRLI